MSIAITDEQADLAEATAGFLARVAPTSDTRQRLADFEAGVRPPSWKAVVDQGLTALHLPDELGGGGGHLVDLAIVLEEAGRHLLPGPLLTTSIVSTVVARAGGPAGVDVLRRIVAGAPATLSLAGAVHARRTDDGWALDGDTGPLLSAGEAELFLVAADDSDGGGVGGSGDGRDGHRWFLLRRDHPGLEVTLSPGLDLTRSIGTAHLVDVAVGEDQALSDVDDAWVNDVAAVAFAAEALGAARWCFETTLGYLRQREAFGRVVASFQAVKHRLARALIQLEVMAAAAWDGAVGLEGDVHQRRLAAGGAGVTVVGPAMDFALDCLVLLGGIGFTWEHDIHLYWRRCSALSQLLGSAGGRAAALGTAALAGPRELRVEVDVDAGLRAAVAATLAEIKRLPAEEQRAALAAAGLVAPHYPRPYGLGASAAEQLAIAEEFTRAGLAQPSLIIGEWALPTIIAHGSEAQRERFVPPTLRGEITWCQLFSEPGAGSDLAALSTRAKRVPGGWSLQGQKVWTSSAHVADWGICLARTDPAAPKHQGISYFLVDMRSPGLDVRPLRQSTGAAEFNEVFFDDVFVPDECLVGGQNEGWRLARTTLANERVQMGGSMGFGTDLVANFKRRPSHIPDTGALDTGGPDDGASATLGELTAERQALAALGLRALLRRLAGGQPGAESSVLKVSMGWHQARAAKAALAWAGPAGALGSSEADSPQWRYLSVPSVLVGGGTAEVQLNVIAERVLGLPRG